MDEDSIAEALGIPKEVVIGVLVGEIADEVVNQYDPAKPPEIRVIEQKKFHRSKVIGFISTGGCGASTIAAALTLSFQDHSILAIDLNEYGYMSLLLGKKRRELTPTALGWARGSDIDFIITPGVNYDLILGVSDMNEYIVAMPNKMASLIRAASKKYEYLIVDCPSMPMLWQEVLQELDLIIWVNRTDSACLHNIQNLDAIISPFMDKTVVLFNMAQKGRYRAIPQKMGLTTITDIPYFKKDALMNIKKHLSPLVEIIIGKQVST